MSLEREMTRVCAIVCVHHCYMDDDFGSVWALPGIKDAESEDAPEIEDYPQHPQFVLFADKLYGPIAGKFADAAVRLLECVGVQTRLVTLVDD